MKVLLVLGFVLPLNFSVLAQAADIASQQTIAPAKLSMEFGIELQSLTADRDRTAAKILGLNKCYSDLSAEEKDIVRRYTDSVMTVYTQIYLRRKGPDKEHANTIDGFFNHFNGENSIKVVDHVISAINKSTLPQNELLFRGMKSLPKNQATLKEGDSFFDLGFMSTSISFDIAMQFSIDKDTGTMGVFDIIEAPLGSHGLYLNTNSICGFTMSNYVNEYEVLLAPKTQLQLIKAIALDGITVRYLRITPN